MRYLTFGLVIGLTVAMAAAGAWGQSSQSGAAWEPLDSWLEIEQNVSAHMAGAAEYHFKLARQSFPVKASATADEIRAGAAFLELEAGGVQGAEKEALVAAVGELARLADEVERGVITSHRHLEYSFARAHYVMAEHHYRQTEQSFAKEDLPRVSDHFKSVATHVKRGLSWVGLEIDPGLAAFTRGPSLPAETAEVSKAIRFAGSELDRLGKRIMLAEQQ